MGSWRMLPRSVAAAQDSMRPISQSAWLLLPLLLAAASAVHAEPYMAVREGVRCSGCHVNMTGGGKRNDTIAAHGRDILRYPRFFEKLTKPVDAFTGDINQYLSIGADLRTSLTFEMQDKG